MSEKSGRDEQNPALVAAITAQRKQADKAAKKKKAARKKASKNRKRNS